MSTPSTSPNSTSPNTRPDSTTGSPRKTRVDGGDSSPLTGAHIPTLAEFNPLVAQSLDNRSKVLATLGPKSESPEVIEQLMRNGARGFRMNLSHGTHEEHLARIKTVREVSAKLGIHVAILLDLSGPKMRIGKVPSPQNELQLKGGTEVVLLEQGATCKGKSQGVIIPIPEIPLETVKVGDRVLLADGRVVLKVQKNQNSALICDVVADGIVRTRSGIAFPDSELNLPATSKKDIADAEFGVKCGVNYIAISFVSTPEDGLPVRALLKASRSRAGVIFKFERKAAIQEGMISKLVAACDGLMVARGDLGIDVDPEEVPGIQELLVRLARERQIPSIIATQMLETMIKEPRPTRAEVTDVFFGAKLAADCLMLSGETAIGEFPAEAVGQMSRTALKGAASFEELLGRIDNQHRGSHNLVPGDHGVGSWAAIAAKDSNIVAIVCCTATGKTARLVSSHKPKVPIFAVTPNTFTAETTSLLWGVTPLVVPESKTSEEEIRRAVEAVRPYVESRRNPVTEKSPKKPAVLVVYGTTPGVPGSTSTMAKVELRDV